MERSKSLRNLTTRSHRIYSACGSIEDLIGEIGKCRATFPELPVYRELIHSRLQKIQLDLLDIVRGAQIPTSNPKYSSTRMSHDRVVELEDSLNSFKVRPFDGVPGRTVLEAELYLLSVYARRCERLLYASRDATLGLIPDLESLGYLAKLSDFFLMLINYVAKVS